MSSKIREIAETVGALQDTLRVNANASRAIADHFYAQIIGLDLVFMDLVSMLPESERKDILQNQYDESKLGAENDLVGMLKFRKYINRRIQSCRKFIVDKQSSSALKTEGQTEVKE
jgi:hypothetical protein